MRNWLRGSGRSSGYGEMVCSSDGGGSETGAVWRFLGCVDNDDGDDSIRASRSWLETGPFVS